MILFYSNSDSFPFCIESLLFCIESLLYKKAMYTIDPLKYKYFVPLQLQVPLFLFLFFLGRGGKNT